MSNNDLRIEEDRHKRVPTVAERLKHTLLALLLGFLLINIVAFWMFPGIGLGGFYLFSSAHSMVAFIGDITNIIIVTLLAICGIIGWFRGQYFTDRLKSYISFWKFW